METELNADEIFAMAEWIEDQGARFFGRLARSAGGAGAREMLLDLAKMEEDHKNTFSGMRAARAAREHTPPEAEAAKYAGVISRMCVHVESDLVERFTGSEPPDQIVAKVLDFEASTIVFFVAMKEILADSREKSSVDRIIKEELGHILTLSGYVGPAAGQSAIPRRGAGSWLHGQADVH